MSTHNQIQELRKQYLSPSLSLSYNEPIHMVRGKGQYLYDNEGKRYLQGCYIDYDSSEGKLRHLKRSFDY